MLFWVLFSRYPSTDLCVSEQMLDPVSSHRPPPKPNPQNERKIQECIGGNKLNQISLAVISVVWINMARRLKSQANEIDTAAGGYLFIELLGKCSSYRKSRISSVTCLTALSSVTRWTSWTWISSTRGQREKEEENLFINRILAWSALHTHTHTQSQRADLPSSSYRWNDGQGWWMWCQFLELMAS